MALHRNRHLTYHVHVVKHASTNRNSWKCVLIERWQDVFWNHACYIEDVLDIFQADISIWSVIDSWWLHCLGIYCRSSDIDLLNKPSFVSNTRKQNITSPVMFSLRLSEYRLPFGSMVYWGFISSFKCALMFLSKFHWLTPTTHGWRPLDLTYDKSAFIQVMAWGQSITWTYDDHFMDVIWRHSTKFVKLSTLSQYLYLSNICYLPYVHK